MSQSGWTEVRVLAPLGWQELVAEALTVDGWTSVVFGRASLASAAAPAGYEWVRSFLATNEDDEDDGAIRSALVERLRDLADRVGDAELAALEPTFHELPAEDWATSWKKTWRPFRVGRLCIVTPDWASDLRPTDVRLILEPGAAFGTGRHCTTRMCLATLQERLEASSRVLDAGCGSGILSVAAARVGAGAVLGFDVDPRAPRQAGELASDNNVGDRCEFRLGGFEVLAADDSDFDAVLANIYSDVLQAHAGELARRLRPDGWFAFSGCPDRHGEPTGASIERAGLQIAEVRQRGRWLTFIGRKGS